MVATVRDFYKGQSSRYRCDVAAQRLGDELRRTDRLKMRSIDSNFKNGRDLGAALRRQIQRRVGRLRPLV
jgi:hypothetical protein